MHQQIKDTLVKIVLVQYTDVQVENFEVIHEKANRTVGQVGFRFGLHMYFDLKQQLQDYQILLLVNLFAFNNHEFKKMDLKLQALFYSLNGNGIQLIMKQQ